MFINITHNQKDQEANNWKVPFNIIKEFPTFHMQKHQLDQEQIVN